MEEATQEPTVSFGLGLVLAQLAILFDVIQWFVSFTALIPLAGIVVVFILNGAVNAIALFVFALVLSYSGFSVLSLRRGGSLIGTTLIESIPGVNILPAWSLWTTIFILTNLAGSAIEKASESSLLE